MRQLVLAPGIFLVALLWQAPATLIDLLVDRASGGVLRVAEAKGSIWSGQGLMIRAAQRSGRWIPQMPVSWSLDVPRLLDGLLAWKISSGGAGIAIVGVGLRGIAASQVHLRGPTSMFVAPFPRSVALAGWRGDMDVQATKFECTWHGHCAGRMELQWNGASSDLLPGRMLGNYRLTTDGRPGDELRFQLKTAEGAVGLQGDGTWRADGSISFRGTIKGEPELLQRLPSIAGPWVQPTSDPGTWTLSIERGSTAPSKP